MTLSEFLLARITEDEAVANEAARHRTNTSSYNVSDLYLRHGQVAGMTWRATYDEVYAWGDDERGKIAAVGNFGMALTKHIARHDPARVLAECEAKRRIVDLADEFTELEDDRWHRVGIEAGFMRPPFLTRTLLEALALPYADHPDYRPEWK